MRLFILTVLIVVMGISVSGWAESNMKVAGEVHRIKGSAVAVQNAQVRPLQPGDDVYIGDILSTGSGGGLEIVMIDQGVFSLGEMTSFVVIDYTFGTGPKNAVVELLQGALDGATGAIGKQAGLDVRTPVATAGIRGTKFFVGQEEEGYSFAHWAGGGVRVQNFAGKVFLEGKNTGTFVTGQKSRPGPVKPWDGAKKAAAKSRTTF